MRSDGSCDISASFIVSRFNELHCILGSDVLHDYPQGRTSLDNWLQNSLDEDRFPVKDIHRRIHYLSVHQQRKIHLRHRLQGIHTYITLHTYTHTMTTATIRTGAMHYLQSNQYAIQRRHSELTVRGGPCRVQLVSMNQA